MLYFITSETVKPSNRSNIQNLKAPQTSAWH
jgi:hypothetical protein